MRGQNAPDMHPRPPPPPPEARTALERLYSGPAALSLRAELLQGKKALPMCCSTQAKSKLRTALVLRQCNLSTMRRREVNCWVLPRGRPLNNTLGISAAAEGRKAGYMCCRPKYARYFRVLSPCRTENSLPMHSALFAFNAC